MVANTDSRLDRRRFLSALTIGALAGVASVSAGQADAREIDHLIAKARGLPISQRIAVISRALLGRRYAAHTLIGGPRQHEVFIVRDDRFDCVTFCETVLAAAEAQDLPSFSAALRAIRYRNGAVAWRERNHDWAAWCERNVANGFCQRVALGAPVKLRKVIDWPPALGRRSYTIAAAAANALVLDRASLQDGDIVGFISHRPMLDYFHTGFVMIGAGGEPMLRHASQSHGRVVDQPMRSFLAVNRVRYVSVLRPQERQGRAT